jgi:hypothetical protein
VRKNPAAQNFEQCNEDIAQLQNEASLRDFLKNGKFTAPKRRNSARQHRFLKLTTPKKKQVCETFSKNESSQRRNSARLHHFVKLTTLKTKQVCETFSKMEVHSSKTTKFSEHSSVFEVDNIKNETGPRDFSKKRKLMAPKRQSSARLHRFLKLTTSKMKQLCKTSCKNGKLSAKLTASYQCVL